MTQKDWKKEWDKKGLKYNKRMFKDFEKIELVSEPFADLREKSQKLMRNYYLEKGEEKIAKNFMKTEEQKECKKVYTGAITIIYKIENNNRKFLLVESTETGNISFVSGATEKEDRNSQDTAKREIKEEIALRESEYSLEETDLRQEFVFNKKKKERAGCKAIYYVFLAKVKNSAEIKMTKEIKNFLWLGEKEVMEKLSFPEIKRVFGESLELINKN